MIIRLVIAFAAAAPALTAATAATSVFVAPSGRVYSAPKGEAYPSSAWFAEIDLNHDRQVSLAEFKADFAAYFDQLDLNKDSILSVQEIHDYENSALRGIVGSGGSQTQIAQEIAKIDQNSGTATDQEQLLSKLNSAALADDTMSGAGKFGLIPIPQPVSAMDMDFDGRVSRVEMQMAATRRFKLIAGSATALTLDNLPKTASQRR